MPRITLNILGRDYPFDVADEEVDNLKAAADILNSRASEIRSHNRALTPERLAVMASLQIAYDSLIGNLVPVAVDEKTISRLAAMRMRCDEALNPALNA